MAVVSGSYSSVVFSRLKEVGNGLVAQMRPWGEILDRQSYSKPGDLSEATTRVRKNVHYFKVNYLVWLMTVLVICMLANPSSLIVLSSIGAMWTYLFVVRTEPLVISGRPISEREKLIGAGGVSLVVIFFLTSVGSILFSAVSIGLAGVSVHGALREPNDLFLDDGQAFDSSFFGLLPASRPATISVV